MYSASIACTSRQCGHDKPLACGCKRRGLCPPCGARRPAPGAWRVAQMAAHWVDHVISDVPVRQLALSLPIPLPLLLAARPERVTP